MTRDEHIEWCKERALKYLPDNPADAVTSMASDYSKHEETGELNPFLAMAGMMLITQNDIEGVRRWINGFN